MLWQARSGLISGRAAFDPAAGAADAAETTAFLARADAITSVGATERAAYKALINGLVTDGNFSILKALWIRITDTEAHSLLNLASSSFNLTKNGTFGFTANAGGLGGGGYFSTGIVPSAVFSSQDSVTIASYIVNNRTADASDCTVGSGGSGVAYLYQQPKTSGSFFWEVNGTAFPGFTTATAKGAWVSTRTGNIREDLYLNASSTSVSNSTFASSALNANEMLLGAINLDGTPSNMNTSDNIGAVVIANSGVTGAVAASINNRVNDCLKAMSGSALSAF